MKLTTGVGSEERTGKALGCRQCELAGPAVLLLGRISLWASGNDRYGGRNPLGVQELASAS